MATTTAVAVDTSSDYDLDALDEPPTMRHSSVIRITVPTSTTTTTAKDSDVRGGETTARAPPFSSGRNHSTTTSHHQQASSDRATTAPFSCRRWRRLTGKTPESTSKDTVVPIAHPPSHWSFRMKTKGFVSTFPSSSSSSSSSSAGSQPAPSVSSSRSRQHNGGGGGGRGGTSRLQWKDIDRFDTGVMKQLVDKAYGINAQHVATQQLPLQYGSREAQRQCIHSHVYLPAVHRTLDYLQKVRETASSSSSPPPHRTTTHTPRPHAPQRPSQAPQGARQAAAPLGTNPLSTQLSALQAELLTHYEAERRRDAEAVSVPLGLQHDGRLWSAQPQPPIRSHPPHPPSGSSSSSSLSRHPSSSASFRSQRHTHTKSGTRIPRDVAPDQDGDDASTTEDDGGEEAMVLTDSDTYSLSSGVEPDVEMDTLPPPPRPPRRLHTGEEDEETLSVPSATASWSSLESHVLLALEGSDAAQIGSVREPLAVTYDSDDAALLGQSSSCSPSRDGASSHSGSAVSLHTVDGEDRGVDDDGGGCDHVVFVDNGVLVDSSGRVLEQKNDDLATALAMLLQDVEASETCTLSEPQQPFSEELQETLGREVAADEKDLSSGRTDTVENKASPTVAEEKELTGETEEHGQESQESPHAHTVGTVPQSSASEHLDEPLPVRIAATAADSTETEQPAATEIHRSSVTSEVAYDVTDFEELEMNDLESNQGYESFDD